MQTEKLIKEVKKYKKFFEEFGLNPIAYEVNNHKFYLAVYKRNNTEKGNAVISLDSNSKQEYLEAFPVLVTFISLSANIFNIIGQRSKINSAFFFDNVNATSKFIQENGEIKSLRNGIEVLKQLGEWQQELIDLYQEYENYYDNVLLKRNVFTKEDLEYTLDVLSKADMLQFKQGKMLYDNLDLLKIFRKELISNGISQSIPKESNRFLKGLVEDDKNLERTLRDFEFEEKIMNLPYDEQIKRKKLNAQQSALDLTEKLKKTLRYPVI